MSALLLVIGGLLLYFGAQWLVGGSSALALLLRVPQLIIGLTVVAYGTSAPEIVVSIQATLTGHADVAIGNVVGSNVANIGLILGLSALIAPARVDRALARRELPVLLASTAAVPLMLLDGRVEPWEAAGLLGCGAAYTAWMIYAARGAGALQSAILDVVAEEAAADAAGAPKQSSWGWAAITAVIGLCVLLLGGKLFVDSAIQIAQRLGLSERLIGLTVVALGTSLPELVTSVIAARRGHSDLAIGNVVGSNIFNVFLCLGAAGLSGPVAASLGSLWQDLGALFAMTLLVSLFIRSERTITRFEGGSALVLFLAFTGLVIARG